MKPSIQTLGHILYSPSQYIVPVFQRNYRWENRELEKLWDSLVEIQQPEKIGNHFMGFLVLMPGLAQPGENTAFHVIDGQQRLTSMSLLLAAIRNSASGHKFDSLADEIHQYYLVHPLKKGDDHFRLLPKDRDHDNYVAAIGRDATPIGRIANAVGFFEHKLAGLDASDESALRSIFNTVCQRFEFMCATLETENAYSIFKSLNSTGVALGPSDLIRNFVFMHVEAHDHDLFDSEYWAPLELRFSRPDGTLNEDRFSRFFRDFLILSGRYVSPSNTFQTFEGRYEATGFIPQELTKSLIRYAGHYEVISGRAKDRSEAVTKALTGLNSLESSTTYPLLLALLKLRDEGGLSDHDLSRAVLMLKGFILRRFICGDSSRGYARIFIRAIAQLATDPIKSLRSFLINRGWPDDSRFTGAFVDSPLYQRDYSKHILASLERGRGHKEPADLTDTEIEHIMPQTLNADWRKDLGPDPESVHGNWLHKPGNLTLSAYNRELWNHKFATKSLRYATSNVTITREISNYTAWTEEEIRCRSEKLAKEAAAIWLGPDKF